MPVRIRKVQNNLRSRHQDADFTFAKKRYMLSIVAIFGPENVFVLSIDKTKVPINATAATKQATMIMHVIYEVPNHDLSKVSGPECIPVVVPKNNEPEHFYILAEFFNKCLKESSFSDFSVFHMKGFICGPCV